MLAISHARAARLGRNERGFSLIELGIVIAVIAVLAAVVIFGRGFIVAGRVSKAVEASNSIRKAASTYAGLMGGTITPTTNGLSILQTRELIPTPTNAAGTKMPYGTQWTVAGSATDGFTVQAIGLGLGGQNNTQNAVAITFITPDGARSSDLVASVTKDPNYLPNSPAPGGNGTCAASDPSQVNQTPVTICFTL